MVLRGQYARKAATHSIPGSARLFPDVIPGLVKRWYRANVKPFWRESAGVPEVMC
jgi:hypothetical protein